MVHHQHPPGVQHPPLTKRVLVLAMLLSAGCSQPDACDELCAVGLEAYSGCLTEWGVPWGAFDPYSNETEYQEWCATYTMERRLLAETADTFNAEEALLARCEEQVRALQAGSCDDYYATMQP